MTVAELIAELQNMPGDLPVMMADDDGCYFYNIAHSDVHMRSIAWTAFSPHVAANPETSGTHEVADLSEPFMAVILGDFF